jgi:hypothetical protein
MDNLSVAGENFLAILFLHNEIIQQLEARDGAVRGSSFCTGICEVSASDATTFRKN